MVVRAIDFTTPSDLNDSRFPTVTEQLGVSQVSRLPEQVERFAKSVETRFVATAEMLVRTAEKLEARAEDLRSKARWLLEQRGLANDIREAVTFEQTSMDEVKSLALVDVDMRQDG